LPAAAEQVMSVRESVWLRGLLDAGGVSHLMRKGGLRGWLAPLLLLRLLRDVYRRSSDVDVYHINWLQCALPLPENGRPAVISVLGNDLKLLRVPMMRLLMRRIMRRRRVVLCPNAQWMSVPLHAAFGDIAQIVPVSFGIDPSWYRVKRCYETRSPARWLAITRLTADKLGDLFSWGYRFFGATGRELHLFGPMQEPIDVPTWVHYHGAATPETLAAQWFPSACGLITLSRHAEGRPQVMLEAMASGLPIIASDMPAHASLVADNETGALCNSIDALGRALALIENVDVNVRLGEAARAWAAREVGTWDDCAQRYLRIYSDLLGEGA
jgi:glycosyltransferase involved in cell wall biosynthesis